MTYKPQKGPTTLAVKLSVCWGCMFLTDNADEEPEINSRQYRCTHTHWFGKTTSDQRWITRFPLTPDWCPGEYPQNNMEKTQLR